MQLVIKASFGLESMQQFIINRQDLRSCSKILILFPYSTDFIILNYWVFLFNPYALLKNNLQVLLHILSTWQSVQDDGIQLELDVLCCCSEGLESLLACWVVKLPRAVGKPIVSLCRL